jgi:hypothetical protein
MAACAQAVQQPDGSLVLKLEPTATDLSTCQYVVQSGAELANSLFSMTAEDGAWVSSGIIGVWAAAYGIRSIIDIVRGSSK